LQIFDGEGMALLSPPVGFDGIAEYYEVAVVGYAVYDDSAELIGIDMHIPVSIQ
jgi:hypothetical protein